MGAGTGGTSQVFDLVLNTPVVPPLPTDSSLVNSVLLYNFSPFLVQVKLGTSNAWLGAWMVDKFTIANQSITCTPMLAVGGSASNSTGQLTAAWILVGDDLTDVGTYPAPLFHLAQSLTLVWPDGDPAIQLGPGEQIEFLDDVTGNVTTILSPTNTQWINDNNTGMIWVVPNGQAGTGTYPGIYFYTANSPGDYPNPAWIQTNPDALGNPQIGINNGPYVSTFFGGEVLRQVVFLEAGDGVSSSSIGAIDVSTQSLRGGHYLWADASASVQFRNSAGAATASIVVGDGITSSLVPILTGAWTALPLNNGWSNFGGPYSNAQYRLIADGFVALRGLISPGTIADGTKIATLPASMCPPAQKFLAIVNDGGIPDTRVVITTGGAIQIFGLSSAHDLSFDGIQFESGAYMA